MEEPIKTKEPTPPAPIDKGLLYNSSRWLNLAFNILRGITLPASKVPVIGPFIMPFQYLILGVNTALTYITFGVWKNEGDAYKTLQLEREFYKRANWQNKIYVIFGLLAAASLLLTLAPGFSFIALQICTGFVILSNIFNTLATWNQRHQLSIDLDIMRGKIVSEPSEIKKPDTINIQEATIKLLQDENDKSKYLIEITRDNKTYKFPVPAEDAYLFSNLKFTDKPTGIEINNRDFQLTDTIKVAVTGIINNHINFVLAKADVKQYKLMGKASGVLGASIATTTALLAFVNPVIGLAGLSIAMACYAGYGILAIAMPLYINKSVIPKLAINQSKSEKTSDHNHSKSTEPAPSNDPKNSVTVPSKKEPVLFNKESENQEENAYSLKKPSTNKPEIQ